MDHLIGQRFSLISKSEIRYVGTLHEINPEQSTIALEEVFSFGTEDRTVENFIPPSQQKFEYIVFRGSDVKDIKISEEQSDNKPPSPPPPPNDPAILNSSRPGPPQGPPPPQDRRESPYPPTGYPPPGQFNGYYPPPQFGRGYGPPPPHAGYGPGPAYGPPFHHPPPGYFGPPGQGFPQGPNQFPHPQPPPIGPPGQQQPPQQQQQQQSPSNAPQVPGPVQNAKQTQELPVEKSAAKDGSQTPIPQPTQAGPLSGAADPTGKNPQAPKSFAQTAAAAAPTQIKSTRVTPAMPLTVNQKSFTPPVPATAPPAAATNGSAKPVTAQTSIEEASRQAKEAVAAAMAKLNPATTAPKTVVPDNSVDSLARKVGELNTGSNSTRGRGGFRGGRGARSTSGGQSRKVEIPKSDFDFESANAKFNKEDLIKEAIASGSPLGEQPDNSLNGESYVDGSEGPVRKDSASQVSAYNKSSSFFDNISSEARDREENDNRQHGRALRGQEFKKNIETFGQGNVDSGYRGRGRGYGGRGYRGGYNNNRGQRGRGRGRGGGQQPLWAEGTS